MKTCCLLLLVALAPLREIRAAEYAADFLYLGVGAAAAGMGGAWATAGDGVEGCYWNAAVDYSTPGGLMAEQALHFGGLSSWQAVFGKLPIGRATGISAGLLYNRISDLLRYDPLRSGRDLTQPEDRSDFIPLGSFDASSGALLVNVAHATDFSVLLRTGLIPTRLPARIHYGLNLKFISETIDQFTGSALAGDFGLKLYIDGPIISHVRSNSRLILALQINNVFSGDQTWDTAENTAEELHRNFRLGIAWQTAFPDELLSGLRLALERDTYGDDNFHLGASAELWRTLSIRLGGAGTRLLHTSPTFGTGIRYQRLQVDYAFLLHPELEETHRVSLALVL